MKRHMEILAGISLFTAASIGATACGSSPESVTQHPSAREIPYTNSLQRMAKSILILSGKHNAIDSKPPYSLYFTEPTTDGGNLEVEVQTSTNAHNPKQVESIVIGQSLPVSLTSVVYGGVGSFNLSFYVNRDGSWDSYCSDGVNDENALSEVAQNTVFAGNKAVYKDTPDADAVLSDAIYHADSDISSVFTADKINSTQVSAVADPCHVNLG